MNGCLTFDGLKDNCQFFEAILFFKVPCPRGDRICLGICDLKNELTRSKALEGPRIYPPPSPGSSELFAMEPVLCS